MKNLKVKHIHVHKQTKKSAKIECLLKIFSALGTTKFDMQAVQETPFILCR